MALGRDDHSFTAPSQSLVPPQLETDGVFLITSDFLFLAVGNTATLIAAASRPHAEEYLYSASLTFIQQSGSHCSENRKAKINFMSDELTQKAS